MSASPIPHLVDFLTAPLSKSTSGFPPTAVSTARLILAASLARVPEFAKYTLSATSPPAPLLAASIGAGIPWTAWRAALRTSLGLHPGTDTDTARDVKFVHVEDLDKINFEEVRKNDELVVSFGPGYLSVRAEAKDVWAWCPAPGSTSAAVDMEETRGSVVPISRRFRSPGLHHINKDNGTTGLRALDLLSASASARTTVPERDAEHDWHPIRIPRLPPFSSSPLAHPCFPVVESDSESDSDSDYCSDSSAFTSRSTESLTSVSSASSPIIENDTASKSSASSPITQNDRDKAPTLKAPKSYAAVAMAAPTASASKARLPSLAAPAFPSTSSLPFKPTATPKAKTPRTTTLKPSTKTTPMPMPTLAPTLRTPAPTASAYLYAGGVTRVVGGGVMLGPRPPRARVGPCAVLPGVVRSVRS